MLLPAGLPDPKFPLTNLCGCDVEHPIRAASGRLINHPWSERAIIIVILLNGLTMAAETDKKSTLLECIEDFFLLMFTVEMVLKLICSGWYGYIHDRWNLLDFAVVIGGWMPLFLRNDSNFSSMRLLRLLRLASLVHRVKSMRHVVGAFLAATSQVTQVPCR